MARRHHTVIFLPHARAKLRKWRISDTQLRVAAGSLIALTLAAVSASLLYFTDTVDRSEIASLRVENQSLREVNESFETSIRELQGKLTDYEERTLQLAIIAGLDSDAYGGEAGIGGEPYAAERASGRLGGALAIESFDDRMGSLDERLEAIEERLEERSRWIAATPAIAPARGILTSGFGFRRDPLTGVRAFHQGVDIAAGPGQPVRATADGLIVRAGVQGGLGKSVTVAHGFGTSTRYSHLSRIGVEAGREVRRGDVIGYVGNTGRSTGYHLHYEVHVDGSPVDPSRYLFEDPRG